jgi:hypothetical protein
MKTFAYCSASFGRLVRRVAGASPTLCPPTTMATFDPRELKGRDFVLFKLHGLEGQPYWYGDDFTTALSAGQLAQADLQGAVVFVANCWLTDDEGQPGPMLEALMHTEEPHRGPRAVIGGPGSNYALQDRIGGADLLALYVRFLLQVGFSVCNAFKWARVRLQVVRPTYVTRDTLDFRIYANPPRRPV